MKNDSEKYTPVIPETPADYARARMETDAATGNVLSRPHITLRFPSDVAQVGPREIAIPTVPVDYMMFNDAFEKHVHEVMGTDAGDEFLETMVELVHRKMYLSRIR